MARVLKVVLLTVEPGLRVFHAEADARETPEPEQEGLRGWGQSQFHRLQEAVRHSQGRVARATRAVVNWLHKWTHPDEALLGRLRSVEAIDVEHPVSMTEADARATWEAFLAQGRRRHRPWFVVNLLISPVALVGLGLLPGPNVVGYWFAYRAWRDGMILLGIRRAMGGPPETNFRPNPDLDALRSDPRKAALELRVDDKVCARLIQPDRLY